jgi:hypothetical protein
VTTLSKEDALRKIKEKKLIKKRPCLGHDCDEMILGFPGDRLCSSCKSIASAKSSSFGGNYPFKGRAEAVLSD